MDDTGSGRSCLSISIDMGHYIVADFLFTLSGAGKVDVCDVIFQLCHLFGSNRQSKLHFCFCQRNPQLSPGLDPHIGRKQMQHIIGGISRTQRGFILICHGYSPYRMMMLSRSGPTET